MSRINTFERFQQDFARNIKEVVRLSKEQVDEKLSTEFKNLVDRSIEEFYAAQPDVEYSRPMPGLYDLLEMNKKDDQILAHMEPENIGYDPTRRESIRDESGFKEYLFKTTFIRGYHGGADKGPKHPPTDTPYYRRPKPYSYKRKKDGKTIEVKGYYKWGSPAYYDGEDSSPDAKITKGLEDINAKTSELFAQAMDDNIGRLFN